MLERFVADADIDVVALTRANARAALDGFRQFGKGRHHAGLNLGDCYTYGLAIEEEATVLCTGDDFVQTDLRVVTPR
jgi:ribonuclease VapC